jgi:hypothetical protein
MNLQFSDNPIYTRYESLLFVLDDLDAIGKNDSDEAEQIRTEMDMLYYNLSESEQIRLGGLSADLYMLRGEENPQKLAEGETLRTVETTLRSAWQQKDMATVLEYLRKASGFLHPETVASLRAYAYQKLGHFRVAYAFKRLAAELNPQQVGHRVGLMELLCLMGDWDMAFMEARFILASSLTTEEMRQSATLVLILGTTPETERAERAKNNFATAENVQHNIYEKLLAAPVGPS